MSEAAQVISPARKLSEAPRSRYGLLAFLTVWFGQSVSTIGSGLSGFALAVWVFQQTGSATRFSLIALCAATPGILISPLLGVIVDRYHRRRLMIVANVVASFCTAVLAILYMRGNLQLWHICALTVCISITSSLLSPSYSAAIAVLVPKKYLGRASGMVQLSGASAEMLAPLLAGFLISAIHIDGILFVDLASYLFAILSLCLVRLPEIARDNSPSVKPSMVGDVTAGIRYLTARPGLLALIGYFTVTNFLLGMENVLMPPLVMSFAGAKIYGIIAAVGGSAFLLGSLIMSSWGGPKHRIRGVYSYGIALGVALAMESLRPNPWLIGAGVFLVAVATPIANGCSIPILQSKTDPAFQGRVYATMRFLVGCGVPISYLSAGALADKIFEPLMARNNFVHNSFGRIFGFGPGRGTALLLFTLAIFALLFAIRSLWYRPLRRVESDIPDAVTLKPQITS